MSYKLCKFCENRARDTPLRGVYIPHFRKIWVKISISRVLHPCRCTDGGEIDTEEGTFVPNFTPSVQRVAPAGRKTSKSAALPLGWPCVVFNLMSYVHFLCMQMLIWGSSFCLNKNIHWVHTTALRVYLGLLGKDSKGTSVSPFA